MIVFEHLIKKKGKRLVLNHISFKIKKGECAFLLGPNGSGKTTILRTAAGLLKPDKGKVFIGGFNASEEENTLKIREMIGYLAHESMLYPELTVEENLLFSGMMYLLTEDYTKRKMDYLLETLRLSHRKHDKVKSLSRGMKQKISIARVLLHEPEILLLDEPLTGLDKNSVKVFKSILLKEKRKGKTILLASHKPEELEDVADTFIYLHTGRIVSVERKA
ncbi:MAG TPA: heme ABC exporter ATP-binding protein CcmA [Thermoplasmata archaeon]|nr:heme ABC exporter ATP-binding protein CcmA [Thermoplasmata archaeon]